MFDRIRDVVAVLVDPNDRVGSVRRRARELAETTLSEFGDALLWDRIRQLEYQVCEADAEINRGQADASAEVEAKLGELCAEHASELARRMVLERELGSVKRELLETARLATAQAKVLNMTRECMAPLWEGRPGVPVGNGKVVLSLSVGEWRNILVLKDWTVRRMLAALDEKPAEGPN